MTFEFRNYPPLLASRKPTPYFSLEEKFAFYSGKKWFFSQKGVLTVCLRKKRKVSEKMDVFCNPFSSFLNHDCINVSYGWSFCFALIFSCTLHLCSKVMVLTKRWEEKWNEEEELCYKFLIKVYYQTLNNLWGLKLLIKTFCWASSGILQ